MITFLSKQNSIITENITQNKIGQQDNTLTTFTYKLIQSIKLS